jgi:hypothetical protein
MFIGVDIALIFNGLRKAGDADFSDLAVCRGFGWGRKTNPR